MLETPSIPRYREACGENPSGADNQQGSRRHAVDPSETTREALELVASSEDMVRPSWRREEPDRNDRAAVCNQDRGNRDA